MSCTSLYLPPSHPKLWGTAESDSQILQGPPFILFPSPPFCGVTRYISINFGFENFPRCKYKIAFDFFFLIFLPFFFFFIVEGNPNPKRKKRKEKKKNKVMGPNLQYDIKWRSKSERSRSFYARSRLGGKADFACGGGVFFLVVAEK